MVRETDPVAVLIPTMRRPESLARALRSVFAQADVADRLDEIVVIDNDPTGSAAEVVSALKADSPCPLIYCHEPRPGVATARNAGLARTEAPLIAFLDDDEAAEPEWLARLIQARQALGADVVFGPIHGRVPEGTGWASPYLERFFGREGPAETRLLDHAYGCGNSLMLRETALPGATPFDPAADRSGGEDDALFQALEQRGGQFGWAADAWVDEFAPPHRATMRYALARAFAYGQSPSQLAARENRPLHVIRWMLIGLAQAVVWGLAAIVLTVMGRPRRADMMDCAARGLGKIFWFKGLEPQFYGARELARLDALKAA
jgi:glycosyltransferase involved in cell wall biosynthesis